MTSHDFDTLREQLRGVYTNACTRPLSYFAAPLLGYLQQLDLECRKSSVATAADFFFLVDECLETMRAWSTIHADADDVWAASITEADRVYVSEITESWQQAAFSLSAARNPKGLLSVPVFTVPSDSSSLPQAVASSSPCSLVLSVIDRNYVFNVSLTARHFLSENIVKNVRTLAADTTKPLQSYFELLAHLIPNNSVWSEFLSFRRDCLEPHTRDRMALLQEKRKTLVALQAPRKFELHQEMARLSRLGDTIVQYLKVDLPLLSAVFCDAPDGMLRKPKPSSLSHQSQYQTAPGETEPGGFITTDIHLSPHSRSCSHMTGDSSPAHHSHLRPPMLDPNVQLLQPSRSVDSVFDPAMRTLPPTRSLPDLVFAAYLSVYAAVCQRKIAGFMQQSARVSDANPVLRPLDLEFLQHVLRTIDQFLMPVHGLLVSSGYFTAQQADELLFQRTLLHEVWAEHKQTIVDLLASKITASFNTALQSVCAGRSSGSEGVEGSVGVEGSETTAGFETVTECKPANSSSKLFRSGLKLKSGGSLLRGSGRTTGGGACRNTGAAISEDFRSGAQRSIRGKLTAASLFVVMRNPGAAAAVGGTVQSHTTSSSPPSSSSPLAVVKAETLPRMVLKSALGITGVLEAVLLVVAHPSCAFARASFVERLRVGMSQYANAVLRRSYDMPQQCSLPEACLYLNTLLYVKTQLHELLALLGLAPASGAFVAADRSANEEQEEKGTAAEEEAAAKDKPVDELHVAARQLYTCVDHAVAVIFGRMANTLTGYCRAHLFASIHVQGESSWEKQRQLPFTVTCPSAALLAWNTYLRGVISDLQRRQTPLCAIAQLFGQVCLVTACSLVVQYVGIFPSRARLDQYKVDLLVLVMMIRSFSKYLAQLERELFPASLTPHAASSSVPVGVASSAVSPSPLSPDLESPAAAVGTANSVTVDHFLTQLLPSQLLHPSVSTVRLGLDSLACKVFLLYGILSCSSTAVRGTLKAFATPPAERSGPFSEVRMAQLESDLSQCVPFVWDPPSIGLSLDSDPFDPPSAHCSLGSASIGELTQSLLRAGSRQSAAVWETVLLGAETALTPSEWLSFVAKRTELRPDDHPPLADLEEAEAEALKEAMAHFVRRMSRGAEARTAPPPLPACQND